MIQYCVLQALVLRINKCFTVGQPRNKACSGAAGERIRWVQIGRLGLGHTHDYHRRNEENGAESVETGLGSQDLCEKPGEGLDSKSRAFDSPCLTSKRTVRGSDAGDIQKCCAWKMKGWATMQVSGCRMGKCHRDPAAAGRETGRSH